MGAQGPDRSKRAEWPQYYTNRIRRTYRPVTGASRGADLRRHGSGVRLDYGTATWWHVPPMSGLVFPGPTLMA
jgi:hypothetical protein